MIDQKIYLCFPKNWDDQLNEAKRCRYGSNPTDKFKEIRRTSYTHTKTKIAVSESKTEQSHEI